MTPAIRPQHWTGRSTDRSDALVIDLEAHVVRLGGRTVPLSPREFDLLHYLQRHAGRAVSRAELLEHVWGADSRYLDNSTVTVHIRRLRTKLEPDPAEPRLVVTVRGGGYRFDPPHLPEIPGSGSQPTGSEGLAELLVAGERDIAVQVALRLLQTTGCLERVVSTLLVPALHTFGARWYDGVWSVSDEHTATAGMQRVIAALAFASATPATEGHVVLATAEGEEDTARGELVAEILRSRGWAVTYVEGSAPATELGRLLDRVRPDALLISCTTATGLPGAARAAAVARVRGCPTVVGGTAVSSDDDARRLGATAWAATPTEAADRVREVALARPPTPRADLDRAGPGALLAADVERLVGLCLGDDVAQGLSTEDRRADLFWLTAMLRTTAAALVIQDRGLLDDHLSWRQGEPGPTLPLLGLRSSVEATSAMLLAHGHREGAALLLEASGALTR